MKTEILHGSSAAFIAAFAGLLLLPQVASAQPTGASARELLFVFEGLIGTFRTVDVGVPTTFPPGEIEINFGPSKGRFEKAPRCVLPDCGFVSVMADGSFFTAPAQFHGHNAGWQLLITSTPPHEPSAGTADPEADSGIIYGSLLYCPGYEFNGDIEQCPLPGLGTERKQGRLDPPPRADPSDDPSVPGPLPLFGVAAAFGFSRRLRSRIQATSSGSSRTGGAPPGPRPAAG